MEEKAIATGARTAAYVGIANSIFAAEKLAEDAITLFTYLTAAQEAGVEVFITAAHLPGIVAAKTLLPVLGVPMPSSTFTDGLDALLSIVQMPAGIPVALWQWAKQAPLRLRLKVNLLQIIGWYIKVTRI
ncbi:AIR carboxylase family protein [Legionella clemsonensis]|uniref:N5-carboxyaminoimidazole ribonucleotide mutase n=1 Tax=Legionella clemsonensis TaxID=1867846 RepID=A0A222P4W0_9GAMM|nr:N5-carboxyaminoimidazole ribonucleotide mutase [Legionella clemsonensis]